jgi:hypothetical protein
MNFHSLVADIYMILRVLIIIFIGALLVQFFGIVDVPDNTGDILFTLIVCRVLLPVPNIIMNFISSHNEY